MPHISLQGCNTERGITLIDIHANVQFRESNPYSDNVQEWKLSEIREDLENLVKIYFSNIESSAISDKEWNEKMNQI